LKEINMTVFFNILDADWPACDDGVRWPPAGMFVNPSNENARDLLKWLGLPHDKLYGEVKARELAALVRRRLWPERRHSDDPGRPASIHHSESGPVVIMFGREPGRLAQYAERLLALADHAGDGTIVWY
jgi:hypothetical protein